MTICKAHVLDTKAVRHANLSFFPITYVHKYLPCAGWLDCAARTVREEGRAALFRGIAPTLGRAALVNATLFPTYEALMWLMRGHDPADVH